MNYTTKPTGDVTVIIPVLVNSKQVDAKNPLLLYKPPAPTLEDKKRKLKEISVVENWREQLAALGAAREAPGGKKARANA